MKIVVLGQGNVAQYFIKALGALHVNSHIPGDVPPDTDLCIIAVTDRAIAGVSAGVNAPNAVVVHTSGTTDISVLASHGKHGVIYPLQTLSRDVGISPFKVPLLLEGSDPGTCEMLKDVAEKIGSPWRIASSEERRKAHLAAVFANNFTNHLLEIAWRLAPDAELLPLMCQTFENATTIGPYEAQTGPARRGDTRTIESQLSQLPEDLKPVYRALTQSIINTYKKPSQ